MRQHKSLIGFHEYADLDEQPSMCATVDAIVKDDGPGEVSGDWGCVIADDDDRLIAFWLVWSNDRAPESDD